MIPLFKPYNPDHVAEGIQDILDSGQLIFGKWGNLLEAQVKQYLTNENVLLINSYATAVYIVFNTLGIKRGDEVILSPMCCLQSTQPLLMLGVKIVWGDIDPHTGTLNPQDVIGKITSRTKAIIHNQHLGYVGYVKEIAEIAKQFGLFVIDDCIDGIGGEYQTLKIGNIGSDATIFSFGAVRLPNAIEGACIIFNNPALMTEARKARDLGVDRKIFRTASGEISRECDISSIGYSGLMNEINAYVAYQQMPKLDQLLAIQEQNALKWAEFVEDNNLACRPLNLVEGTKPNYWVYGLLSDERDKCIDYFKELGYAASRVHLNNNLYSVFNSYKQLKGVNEFYKQFFAIPSGWWVSLQRK